MNYYNNYMDILINLNDTEVDLLEELFTFSEEDNLIKIDLPSWNTQLEVAYYTFSEKRKKQVLKKFIKLKILIPLSCDIAVINPLYFHKGEEILRLDLVKELIELVTRERLEYGSIR